MANVSAPRGLIPYRMATNAYDTGGLGLYYVPSTYNQVMYVGDPVAATGASDAFGVPVVGLATAAGSNYILGAFVAIANGGPNGAVVAVTRDQPVYHVAATSQYILVSHDPNQMYVMQEDSNGGAITVATAGTKNVSLIAGTGSSVTGYSGWQLDSSTINTTALQMRIMQALVEEDNTPGLDYAKWLVRINLHALNNTTGV